MPNNRSPFLNADGSINMSEALQAGRKARSQAFHRMIRADDPFRKTDRLPPVTGNLGPRDLALVRFLLFPLGLGNGLPATSERI